MLIVRETGANYFEELPAGLPIVTGTDLYPWQITELWSAAQLAAIHLYRVTIPEVPEGKTLVSHSISRIAGVVSYIPVYDDLPPPKLVATPQQIRLALTQFNLRQVIEDYVQSQDITVKDSWEYTTEFEIDHPIIIAGQAALGISDEQVRALFELAITL